MSRPKAAYIATGKFVKGTGKALATGLIAAPIAAVATGVRVLGTGAYAATLRVKAGVQTAASLPKLAYQAEKLRQAQRTMNRVTGADVYKTHTDKHQKLLANFQAQQKKYGSMADGGEKKMESIVQKFQANKAKLNAALEKRVTGTSKWSRFYKPLTAKSKYKMSSEDFAAKIKSQSIDPSKPLDFSEIIKQKQADYNAVQTAKKDAKKAKIIGEKGSSVNARKIEFNTTKATLDTAKAESNKIQKEINNLNSKANLLTMSEGDRKEHYTKKKTLFKTKSDADTKLKMAQTEHTKITSLYEKAKKELEGKEALANKKLSKKNIIQLPICKVV